MFYPTNGVYFKLDAILMTDEEYIDTVRRAREESVRLVASFAIAVTHWLNGVPFCPGTWVLLCPWQ